RARAREPVEQSRFSGVGVADNRGQRPMAALPAVALGGSLPAHGFQFIGDSGDSVLDAAAVRFQLRFTVTPHPDTALLARQVAPKPGQPRQQMLQLREFDLQLAFFGAGALGENVENERSPIDDLALEDILQIAALSGGKFVVKNDGIDILFATM